MTIARLISFPKSHIAYYWLSVIRVCIENDGFFEEGKNDT